MASVSVPYDSTLIPKGYTVDDIHTYYYDEAHHQWTILKKQGIDTLRAVAMAETSHFTDIINGIIKVPESPETQNYVPTSINELKAADPTAGIQQIEAPTTNQNGTANLSYPFETPPGRVGLGVGAGLQYSSDGGSSFVGYGWSLPMQSIDIETRWGVPRFSEDKETESYLLEGKPLSDRTYRRAEDIDREPEKRFYPMVEGDFSKIVRKGDSPRSYYWEVTTKSGTVYSYGGYDGRVSDETSLTDDRGNRIKWALHRITDVHGNFASFHYVKSSGHLYPLRYTWTGYGSEDGEYSIEFDIDLSGGVRKDVTRSGRLGILQTDRALLRKVTVTNAGRPLRSYNPRYESGPFGKTLLVGIDQLDSHGRSVATQVFDYHNDIEDGLFAETETWTFNNEGVNTGAGGKEKLLAYSVEGCDDTLTPLGGGSSRGSTSGGGLMVGAGVLGGTVNVGTSYAHAKNESTGKVAFVDIDGDGLPDKVFQLSGSLYYCKNLGADKEVAAFASPMKIEGVRGFSSSVSTSNSVHTNIGVDYSLASAGISYIHTSDQEKTKTYFNDFNGDGLMDIAQNGTVYFNHIADGRPKFIATSTGTANPIVGTGTGLSDEFRPDYAAERDSLEREYPLSDAVRM